MTVTLLPAGLPFLRLHPDLRPCPAARPDWSPVLAEVEERIADLIDQAEIGAARLLEEARS